MTQLAALIATWFGIGRLPRAPGTWGSLVALPLAWGIVWAGGPFLLLVAIIVLCTAGTWASSVYLQTTGRDDPPEVVVDEVVGQWLVLLVAPLSPVAYGVGFVLFRVLDIWKPWPIRWVDRNLTGGFGVMADDLLAGAVGLVLLDSFTRTWL